MPKTKQVGRHLTGGIAPNVRLAAETARATAPKNGGVKNVSGGGHGYAQPIRRYRALEEEVRLVEAEQAEVRDRVVAAKRRERELREERDRFVRECESLEARLIARQRKLEARLAGHGFSVESDVDFVEERIAEERAKRDAIIRSHNALGTIAAGQLRSSFARFGI